MTARSAMRYPSSISATVDRGPDRIIQYLGTRRPGEFVTQARSAAGDKKKKENTLVKKKKLNKKPFITMIQNGKGTRLNYYYYPLQLLI